MECGGGKTPWKIWQTAICERIVSLVPQKKTEEKKKQEHL